MRKPQTEEAILKIAEKYGWDVEEDNDGQLVIYTGILAAGYEECTACGFSKEEGKPCIHCSDDGEDDGGEEE